MTADKLVVDWTRCDAHGLCAELLPEVVELDDWGYPIVADVPVPADRRSLVSRAVRACPALALRVVAKAPRR